MLEPSDHRHQGNQLDLFHFEESAPGMVFWHPRGLVLMRVLEEAVRREMRRQGLSEVRTPQLLRLPVWERSGHLACFSEGMFRVEEDRPAALKPVSCPAHLAIANRRILSYRDLPYRLGELGVVHRNERSGVLHGLLRLRQFTQDDGHILCAEEQVADEVQRFCERLKVFYAAFELQQVSVGFSTRPAQRLGDDALWDRAEAVLYDSAERAGLVLDEQPGEGAFYGPKLEMVLRDRMGRSWQCGTIQLDLVMPERFDVAYIDVEGKRRRPALLHRALLGSVERFLGIVLESYGGALPAWLAPEQIAVLPVKEAHGYARELAHQLEAAGLRASVDDRADTLGRRVLSAHERAVAFVAVVGEREMRARSVSLREGQSQREMPIDAALAELAERCRPPI